MSFVAPPVFPVVTTEQRDNLVNAQPGACVINSDTDSLDYKTDEGDWVSLTGT